MSVGSETHQSATAVTAVESKKKKRTKKKSLKKKKKKKKKKKGTPNCELFQTSSESNEESSLSESDEEMVSTKSTAKDLDDGGGKPKAPSKKKDGGVKRKKITLKTPPLSPQTKLETKLAKEREMQVSALGEEMNRLDHLRDTATTKRKREVVEWRLAELEKQEEQTARIKENKLVCAEWRDESKDWWENFGGMLAGVRKEISLHRT